jgi:solute carrier family 25 thiamine pyrophosphate transporter 19
VFYKGTLSTMRHIVANEGVRGLWKGNVPAELMYVCYSAVQFTAYRSTALALQHVFGRDGLPHAAESFIAGATAGAVATAATYPLDLLRTRFAAQGNDRVYLSLRRAVVDIARDEGPRGFFRGLAPAVGQIIPYMGIFFATYEALRLRLKDVDGIIGGGGDKRDGVGGGSGGAGAGRLAPSSWGGGDAAAGVLASVISKTAVFPLDLVRKRIQVQGPTRGRYVHKNIPEYSQGTLHALRAIVRSEGARGLYRGLTVSLIKAAPGSAVTVWTYERVLRLLMASEAGRADDVHL